MTVRKVWVVLGLLACGLFLTAPSQAAVKGVCSICHTMHNSQQGAPVAFTRDSAGQIVISEEPLANLLKTDCLGCHSQAGAETIVNMEGAQIPIVFNLTEPTYPPDGSATSTLAGGNFHWVMNSGSAYGHNVEGIASADFRFPPNQAPGGVVRTGDCINCHGTLASVQSGCQGCHVVQHHADSAEIVASRENGWYRFLGSVMQHADNPKELTTEGVMGIEAIDWEQNPLSTQHNVYQGKAGPYVNYLESGAMDQKCAGCHGQFHNETIADSTWIRHPVDVAIPDIGEFTGFTTYNPLVPVARQNVRSEDVGFADINRGSDMVSCVSCHRPHGSPYPAMLRWGYRDWPGNDSHTQQAAQNGCAVCHTSKS
jgi:hypothetical protein